MNNSFEKVAEKFADLMIEKIETIETNWETPWFSCVNTTTFLPQNLSGRKYSGGNAILLLILSQMYGYNTPVFLTFKQAKEKGLNILKGSKSYPVYYTLFTAYHKETNKKISFDEYLILSKDERKAYRLVGANKFFHVFNLDQTNFSEKFPGEWEKFITKFKKEGIKDEKDYNNEPLNNLIASNSWVCPIREIAINKAYYSLSEDAITIPERKQFKESDGFYSTLLHEMAHSTGIESRLKRDGFGEGERDLKSYGREELVAELSSGLCSFLFGISTGIREENVQYLKSWIKSIKESPKFLLSVLNDSMKVVRFTADYLKINIDEASNESKIKEAV